MTVPLSYLKSGQKMDVKSGQKTNLMEDISADLQINIEKRDKAKSGQKTDVKSGQKHNGRKGGYKTGSDTREKRIMSVTNKAIQV